MLTEATVTKSLPCVSALSKEGDFPLVKPQAFLVGGSSSVVLGSRVIGTSLPIAVMKERRTKQPDGMQRLAVGASGKCYDGRSVPFWFSHQ